MVFIVFNCKYTYNLQTCQIVVLKSCLCVFLFLSRNDVSFPIFSAGFMYVYLSFSRAKGHLYRFIFTSENIYLRESKYLFS